MKVMIELTPERINSLHQKLTLLTGAKGEGNSVFTFQDFYDLEVLIEFYKLQLVAEKKIERVREECKGKLERLKGCVDNPIFVEDNPRVAAAINAYGHILKILEEEE